MAKETKDLEQTKKKQVKKRTSTIKKTSSATKKVSTKKTTSKVATSTKKSTAKKVSSSSKKASSRGSTKKSSTTTKKTASKRTSALKKEKEFTQFKSEYYDLPYMYNKTVVKILAQTPKMLFIYWEISEDDRNNLIQVFGDNFFEITTPVLIVYNDTLHYSFEVSINDFANSWYLHIDDANCDYHVELGRRPYPDSYSNQPVYIPYYIYLTTSNEMTSPNNKILFNSNMTSVKFRNVKTGQTVEKDIRQFKFITNFGIFTIADLYKYLYPNESFEYENIVVGNTSSGALSSSGLFSSQFK